MKESLPGFQRLYLISEAKGSPFELDRCGSENAKILCGKAHFDALGVTYKQVTSAAEV